MWFETSMLGCHFDFLQLSCISQCFFISFPKDSGYSWVNDYCTPPPLDSAVTQLPSTPQRISNMFHMPWKYFTFDLCDINRVEIMSISHEGSQTFHNDFHIVMYGELPSYRQKFPPDTRNTQEGVSQLPSVFHPWILDEFLSINVFFVKD